MVSLPPTGRKLTCTPVTLEGQLKKLATLARAGAAGEIENSIANGWQSVCYQSKGASQNGRNGTARNQPMPTGPGQRHAVDAAGRGVEPGLSRASEFEELVRQRNPNLFREPSAEESAQCEVREEQRRRNEAAQEIAERRRQFDAALGRRYRGASFASFETEHKGQGAVAEALKRYAGDISSEVEQGHGVVLFGPPGTGQTTCWRCWGVSPSAKAFVLPGSTGSTCSAGCAMPSMPRRARGS